jgi:hypothetical protein
MAMTRLPIQVRVARHTSRLTEIARFYRDGLGLPEIGRFSGHAGYDGISSTCREGACTSSVATTALRRRTRSRFSSSTSRARFYQRLGFRVLCVERDAFTPRNGYPPIDSDGVPLRDRSPRIVIARGMSYDLSRSTIAARQMFDEDEGATERE